MGDAERMISVAELLRREGVGPSEQPRKRGRVAATAAGVVALCGAAATGIIGFAPALSTSPDLGDGDGAAQHDGSSDGGVALGGEDRTSGSDGGTPFVRTSTQRSATSDDAERRVPAMTWLSDDVAADRTSSQWPTVDQDDAAGGAGSGHEERAPRTTSGDRQHDTGGTEDDGGSRDQSENTGSRGGHDDAEDAQRGHGDADSGSQDNGGSGGAEGGSAQGGAEDGHGGEESGGHESGQGSQAPEGDGNSEGQGNADDRGSASEDRGSASEDRGSASEDRGASEQRGNQPDERGQSHERGQSDEHGQGSANSSSPQHAD
ncbi:hypothetical protein [Haloechinothrix halophila]|uniref:hypothetical protein n=1 Tax=Haloechinothrix halophila TaxID=1069073 RepID=UPI000403BC1F|nr:hypothetical protein [Haloechinothrix halophila]